MSTGKLILGIGILAFIGITLSNKKSTIVITSSEKRYQFKQFIKSQLGPGESQDLTVFDRMTDDEIQFLIDVMGTINTGPKYSRPLPSDIIAKFDIISSKYNIFT